MLKTCFLYVAVLAYFSDGSLSAQNVTITPGRATTYVDGPLNDAGWVDFPRLVNDRFKKIDPADNAAIDFLRMYGDFRLYYPPDRTKRFFDLLGVAEDTIPREATAVGSSPYCFDGDRMVESAIRQIDAAVYGGAWTEDRLPVAKQWLDDALPHIEGIDRALDKPHFAIPLVQRQPDSVVFGNPYRFTVEQARQKIGYLLWSHVNLLVGQRKMPEAYRALRRLQRLARVRWPYPTTSTNFYNSIIEDYAARAATTYLSSPELTREMARTFLDDLNKLKPTARAVDSLLSERLTEISIVCESARSWRQNSIERFFGYGALDAFETSQKQRLEKEELDETEQKPFCVRAPAEQIDWDEVLRRINKRHDRRVALHQMADTVERYRQAKLTDNEIDTMQYTFHFANEADFEAAVSKDYESAAKMLTEDVHALYADLSALDGTAVAIEFLARIDMDLTKLTAAFRLFELENGRFPKSLDELVQGGFINAIPTDPYSGKPFKMQKVGDETVLYSVGSNQVDDGGDIDLGEEPPVPDIGLRIQPLSKK